MTSVVVKASMCWLVSVSVSQSSQVSLYDSAALKSNPRCGLLLTLGVDFRQTPETFYKFHLILNDKHTLITPNHTWINFETLISTLE